MDTRAIFNKHLRRGLKASAHLIQEKARQEHNYKSHSGTLERAVDVKTDDTRLKATIFVNKGIANYGVFVHEGSKPHAIFPRNKGVLRWANASGFNFAKRVNHPGYKGDPFLYKALDNSKDEIQNIFDRYVEQATEEIERGLV